MERASGETIAKSVMRRRLCWGELEGDVGGVLGRVRLSMDFGAATAFRVWDEDVGVDDFGEASGSCSGGFVSS